MRARKEVVWVRLVNFPAAVWFRRGRLLIASPVRGHIRHYQAETPLIELFSFAEPPLDLVIGALPDLPEYILLIAGAGPERARLEKLSNELGGANRVRFLGVVPHEELSKTYAAADALVLASSREGWPNVLLEAMACGTPVVASNIWGTPEVVTRPEVGVLMKDRTSESIVEGVRRLCDAKNTREDTRRYAEQFSWDETSQGQYRLFRQVLRD